MASVVAALEEDSGLAGKQGLHRYFYATSLLIGVILFTVPTMIFVIKESWSGEEGAHGPIVLFTGVWLLWKEWPAAIAVAQRPPIVRLSIALASILPLFILSRIAQIVEIEGYLMYGALLIVLYSMIGGAGLRRLWFPLLYLAFLFPPPESIVAAITTPLKMELSGLSINFLDRLGYPIGGQGVRIYIGQYELLVAAACSGLNSIISLTAISLFYIYVRHQADWRYAGLLVLLIMPVALIANFMRVVILILLTYHAGEAAAQGFLHNFAGVFMFAVALATIFGLDEAIRPFWQRAMGRKDD
ncbi:exosortase V [Altererythrobacter salegens]|uniref:Exosortase V n=1 Tax=Croceibacterium salegens TaxID=1737568 RepID=A0A6I4SX84_9SPHN|nr:exosortase V [Croceibacterium salegens]MXO60704.1 exosortase V [Croceibacterium salegens]